MEYVRKGVVSNDSWLLAALQPALIAHERGKPVLFSDRLESGSRLEKNTKIDFHHLDFFRAIKNLRVVQNTERHFVWMKTLGGVVIAICLTVMKQSDAVRDE